MNTPPGTAPSLRPLSQTPAAGAVCPTPVRLPCQIHRWDELTFLHWRYDPRVVQSLLPDGLTVETFDGAAWVGLVPFVMQARFPLVPAVPWLSNFAETNVRTYAVGPDGTRGVWFLSLDAARLAAVVTARTTYHLPYFWSSMSVRRDGRRYTYETRRRWPQPAPVSSFVQVDVGEPYDPSELTDFEHWLTARWTLFSAFPRSLWLARAEHAPWSLRRASVRRVDDGLIVASGLPAPVGEPLVHHSAGTEVRIGIPKRVWR